MRVSLAPTRDAHDSSWIKSFSFANGAWTRRPIHTRNYLLHSTHIYMQLITLNNFGFKNQVGMLDCWFGVSWCAKKIVLASRLYVYLFLRDNVNDRRATRRISKILSENSMFVISNLDHNDERSKEFSVTRFSASTQASVICTYAIGGVRSHRSNLFGNTGLVY